MYMYMHIPFYVILYAQKTALYESISCNPRSQYRCRAIVLLLSIQCSVVVFYTPIYMRARARVCVCMCIFIFIQYFVFTKWKKYNSRKLSAFGKRKLWVFSNKQFIQYNIVIISFLYIGEQQDCNDALCHTVFLVGRHPIKPEWERLVSLCENIIRENITFIYHTSDMIKCYNNKLCFA